MIANPSKAVRMLLGLAFTREEQLELETLASSLPGARSFKELLEVWTETAQRLASGNGDGGFSRVYSDGLHARRALEKILHQSPTALGKKLEQVMSRTDGDFKRLTRDDGGASLAHIAGPKDGWWWQRTPSRGDL